MTHWTPIASRGKGQSIRIVNPSSQHYKNVFSTSRGEWYFWVEKIEGTGVPVFGKFLLNMWTIVIFLAALQSTIDKNVLQSLLLLKVRRLRGNIESSGVSGNLGGAEVPFFSSPYATTPLNTPLSYKYFFLWTKNLAAAIFEKKKKITKYETDFRRATRPVERYISWASHLFQSTR